MASPAQTWPGVTQLPDYKPTFPQWKALDLADAVKNVSWLKIHRMNQDETVKLSLKVVYDYVSISNGAQVTPAALDLLAQCLR